MLSQKSFPGLLENDKEIPLAAGCWTQWTVLAGAGAGVVIWAGGFYWLNVKTMCLGSSMIYTTKWQQKEGNVGPRS